MDRYDTFHRRSILARIVGPLANGLAFLPRNPSLAVEDRVFAIRHIAIHHLLADFFEPVLLLLCGITAPFGKVHFLSRPVHIVRHYPRHGSDMAVPGPSSFVGVTVPARALENNLYARGQFQSSVYGVRRVHTRVGPIHRDELHEKEKKEGGKKYFLHPETY